MARLKALFVSLYPLVALLICGHALWLWWRHGHWLWAGVLLVNAPILVLLGWLVSRGAGHTGPHLPLVTLCTWLGVAVTLLGTLSLGDPRPLAWTYTGIGVLGLCAYLFWYNPLRVDRRAGPRPGQVMPSLSFQNLDGEAVNTASLLGVPAVVLFFRGNWCPLSMAQVRELSRRRPQLERRGARIVLVSALSGARTRRIARRLGLAVEWWSDPGLGAARRLGLLDPRGTPLGLALLGYPPDTVLPTMLIVDARGEIRYVALSDHYRTRPEAAAFLRVLDTMTLAPR